MMSLSGDLDPIDKLIEIKTEDIYKHERPLTTLDEDKTSDSPTNYEEPTNEQIKKEIVIKNESMDDDSSQGSSDIPPSCCSGVEMSSNNIPTFKRENSSSSNDPRVRECSVVLFRVPMQEILQWQNQGTCSKDTTHKYYFCEFCPFKAKSCRELVAHSKDEHQGKDLPFSCSICKYWAGDRQHLMIHMKKHQGMGTQAKGQNPFKCEECKFTTSNFKNLKAHRRRKHSGLPRSGRTWKCRFCTFGPAAFKEFNLHHMTHHPGEEFFKCEVCDFASYSKRNIEGHMWKHVGEKPFKCEMCAASFTLISVMKRHITMVHPGAVFFNCEICDFISYSKQSTEAHKWKHEGEKPFKCEMCATGFTYSNGLKRHIKDAHPGKIAQNKASDFTTSEGLLEKKRQRRSCSPLLNSCHASSAVTALEDRRPNNDGFQATEGSMDFSLINSIVQHTSEVESDASDAEVKFL